jgi:glycosyltransferase involved in cell wall biosynthesis
MKISIVMPTYNGMKYLEQAIHSVLSQKHQDWELIISDDGSTDDTRKYLAVLNDPRIRVYLQPKNLGIFGNLNFLFSCSANQITQILCQDDYFVDEGSLDRLLAEWSGLGPEISFLRCNHLLDTVSNHALFEGEVLPPIVTPEKSDLYFFIFGCIPGNLSNVSVRTEAVKRAGWFRPDLPYAGDFEFWSRLGSTSHWAISKTKVAVIRRHSGQASANLNPSGELLPQLGEILDRLYQNLVGRGYSPLFLRLEATINYISRHRETAVRAAVRKGQRQYLRRVGAELDSSSFGLGQFLGWLIFFGSLGGRLFANSVAKQLLKENPSTS